MALPEYKDQKLNATPLRQKTYYRKPLLSFCFLRLSFAEDGEGKTSCNRQQSGKKSVR